MTTTQLLSFVVGPSFAIAVIAITAYVGYAKEKKAADDAAAEKQKAAAADQAKQAAEKTASDKQDEIQRLGVQISSLVARNTELTQKMADSEPEKMRLLRVVAANVANEKELKEIIEQNSQRLNSDRKISDALFDEIIAQAPAKSGDYRKMVESKEKFIQRRTNVYLVNWKEVFDAVIADFDGMMQKLKASGYPVEVSATPGPYTETPHNSSQQPRSASLGKLRLTLQLNTAGFRSDGFDDAYFFLHLLDAKTNQSLIDPSFSLRIGETSATCGGRDFPVAASGSKDLLDEVRKGMAKVFERMIVVYEAQK